jgi:hypothetical protein
VNLGTRRDGEPFRACDREECEAPKHIEDCFRCAGFGLMRAEGVAGLRKAGRAGRRPRLRPEQLKLLDKVLREGAVNTVSPPLPPLAGGLDFSDGWFDRVCVIRTCYRAFYTVWRFWRFLFSRNLRGLSAARKNDSRRLHALSNLDSII